MIVHYILDEPNRWMTSADASQCRIFVRSEESHNANLPEKICQLQSIDQALSLCSAIKGRFSWIQQVGLQDKPVTIRLAVDLQRSTPLFYAIDGEDVYVGDQPDLIKHRLSAPDPDFLPVAEYLVLGYVTGPDTLIHDIKQVEAGSLVAIHAGDNGPEAKIHSYFSYRHVYRNASRDQFSRDLDDIVLQTMKRAITYADGRPIILPLSGGYDSRLIALMLHRLDYRNVICISYGNRQSAEMKLSREIANQLDFRWIGVHYTHEKWRNWFNRPERSRYYTKAARLSGIPNIQEWVAIGELKENADIPDDGVIMSGHFGDALVGGKGIYDTYTYREHPETDPETILRHILHYHYYLWDWSDYRHILEPIFRDRILGTLLPLENYPDSPGACEAWNIRERQSKYIINTGRLYDFFGYDWWMPFCDPDYLRFWLEIPLAFRHDKSLYTHYIDRMSPMDTPTYNPGKRIIAIREAIRKTPLFEPSRSLYNKWSLHRRRKSEYENHPMAWYGIMEESDFRKLYTGRENINSFQSLELLRTIFENGFLSVDDILHQASNSITSSTNGDHRFEQSSPDSGKSS